MLEDKDVTCHYHCYGDIDATTDVLDRFRRVYPTATVHLISDGGHDFTEVAEKFHCQYHHESWNIGLQVNTDEDHIHEWIRRFAYVCTESVEPWVLILEDDVLIRGKMKPVDYPMAGVESRRAHRKFYDGALGLYLLARHPRMRNMKNNGYGGGGGTLVHRASAVEAIDLYFAKESFNHWHQLTGGITASDLWLTTIMMAAGYQYGQNRDLSEASNWHHTKCSIIHRWKDHQGFV